MNKLLLTGFYSLFVFFAQAQSTRFTTKDSLELFCDKVMQSISERKFSEAIQMFRKRSIMDSSTINNIDKNLVDQMANVEPYYKKIVEYEYIGDRTIKNTIVSRRYLLKFENYFLIFDFVLYNNRTGWTVSNFNYYDNPKELF